MLKSEVESMTCFGVKSGQLSNSIIVQSYKGSEITVLSLNQWLMVKNKSLVMHN